MPFSGLVLQPHELEVVQAVFKTIVAEPWFDRSWGTEKEFAAFVLRAYRDGAAQPERLEPYCRQAAAVRFSTRPQRSWGSSAGSGSSE